MNTFEQKRLVKESFEYIVSQKVNVGDRFYLYLFELRPDLRELFKPNIEEQSEKLADMLVTIVSIIDNEILLDKTLGKLGARHISYGVKRSDYLFVGEALISTLKDIMKDKWSLEIENAWKFIYSIICEKMLRS
jgi:hemoglobin-like flavoprotein